MAMPSSFNVLSNVKRLTTYSVIYGIVGASSAVVGMILIPLYGHVFTPKEFGQLQLAQLWLAIATTVAGLGLTTAYFKFFHEYGSEEERGTTLGIVCGLLVVSVSLGCVMFVTLSLQSVTDHFALLHDPWFFGFFLMSFIGGVFLSIPFQILRAQERSIDYLKIGCIGMGVALLFNLILVGWVRIGVQGALAAQALSALMIIIFSLPFMPFRTMKIVWSSTRAQELLAFGFPLVPAAIALWILEGSDRVFLERYWDVSEVGIYSLAYKYGAILQLALVAFQTAWGPYLFSMAKKTEASMLISRVLTFFATGMMVLTTLLYAVRKPVLSLVASADFAGAESMVGPILLGFLFYGFYFVAISGSYIHGKTGIVAILVGIVAMLNIGLNILIIPTYGGVGAAWTTAMSYLFLAGVMYRFSHKYFPMPLEWHPLAKTLACCVVVAWFCDHLVLQSWEAWVIPFGVVAMIPCVLWFSGFVTPTERQQIRQYLSKYKEAQTSL